MTKDLSISFFSESTERFFCRAFLFLLFIMAGLEINFSWHLIYAVTPCVILSGVESQRDETQSKFCAAQ